MKHPHKASLPVSQQKREKMSFSGGVGGHMLLEALALPHQRPLQNHTAFFIALTVLSGKLIDPAQLTVAVFTADITNHVSARQHHPILHFAVLQIHHLITQKYKISVEYYFTLSVTKHCCRAK